MKPRWSALVPTLGRSSWLEPCLEALRLQGGGNLEIVLVGQSFEPGGAVADLCDRILSLPGNVGFARANNLAFAEAGGELVATVNDDAVVEDDWLATLDAALAEEPEAAAVQGTVLRLDDPGRVDGRGLAWNRWWQAVQIDHGEAAGESDGGDAREVFGVSATAALYRRRALEAVAGPRGEVFDERLFAYYEDVDLACRLRAAGHRAFFVPGARARHAGSTTGARLGSLRRRLIYGNRHLVLARLLGRAYGLRLPGLVLRDLVDLARTLVRGRVSDASGIVAGGARAALLLPRYLRLGAPGVSLDQLRRFRPD